MGLPAVTSHVGKAQTSTHQAQSSQTLSKKQKQIIIHLRIVYRLTILNLIISKVGKAVEYQEIKFDFINGLTPTVQPQ